MRIVKEGDKGQSICENCRKMVTTTCKLRDIPYGDEKNDIGLIRNILVDVCDECDEMVTIPHQSSPQVRDALTAHRKPVELRLPRHLIDILNLSAAKLEAENPSAMTSFLLRYFLHFYFEHKEKRKELKKLLGHELLKDAPASSRLSLKFGKRIYGEMTFLLKDMDFSQSELIKALIIKVHEEILSGKSEEFEKLKSISIAF